MLILLFLIRFATTEMNYAAATASSSSFSAMSVSESKVDFKDGAGFLDSENRLRFPTPCVLRLRPSFSGRRCP